MKQFTLSTKFNFGKHKAETLQEVITLDSTYLDWCLIYHSEFLISDEVLNQIKELLPNFSLTEYAEFARNLKLNNEYPKMPYSKYIWPNLVIKKAFSRQC